jgi:hypothetical protein
VAIYYCSRGDVTDLLPTLVGSDISTATQQDTKLRDPARVWIDSVYPDEAPFQAVPANDPKGWAINSTTHESGATSVSIDGGTGDPAAGDIFAVVLDRQWNRERDDLNPDLSERVYRVTAYSTPTLTYEPQAEQDFPDNAAVTFGTPLLVRRAATLYAVSLAYMIIRNNPLDKEAMAVLQQAKDLLQIPKGGFVARAPTGSTSNRPAGGVAIVRRAG